MSDRFKRIEAIYFRVKDLGERERLRVLDVECRGDAGIRAEVDSLLAFASVPDEFLSTPVLNRAALAQAAGASDDERDAMIGRVVGAYRIKERIASGGMGTVYLGARDDGAFQQQVAIKVVKRGMDTDEIVRRFHLERQTLANMAHPNIAGLIDGGATDDGRPYLVMEFVPGTPIDRYCEKQGLDTVQRLRLFLQVCQAVQSAHQNLVIHRDLKPGNILVTADGVPKLLDFGIAKLLQGPEAAGTTMGEPTIAEQRRLTPEYASPEQIQGLPVTTASDVYSLGVILYELLSGQRPYHFRTRTTSEIERVICHVDPPLPSAVVGKAPDSQAVSPAAPPLPGEEQENIPVSSAGAIQKTRRRLRGDLDTIVLMALRKEPVRRYASVEQLAGDIERYLRDMPVMARKDTFVYRASKFVRRHALVTGAVAAVVVAGMAGALAIAWQAHHTARERDAAFLARDQSEQIAKFLRDTLNSVDPNERGPEATVRQVLDDAATRVDVELKNSPLVHAAVLSAIGTAYLGLGMLDKAEDCITRAMDERQTLLGNGEHDMAESMLDMASMYYARQRYAEAEPLLRRALEIFKSIRGDHNLDIARTSNDLGAVLRALGKPEEAEALHRQALEIRRTHDGIESLTVAESLNNLAGVLIARGDRAGAEEALTEALRIRRASLPPTHARVAQSIGNLAVFYGSGGDYTRAAPLLREALVLEEKSLGMDHPEYALTLTNLAAMEIVLGELADAEALLRRALQIRRVQLASGDARTAYTQGLLGKSLVRQKRYEEAEPELVAALNDLRKAGPSLQSRAASVADDLVRVYEATGRAEEAKAVREATKNP